MARRKVFMKNGNRYYQDSQGKLWIFEHGAVAPTLTRVLPKVKGNKYLRHSVKYITKEVKK